MKLVKPPIDDDDAFDDVLQTPTMKQNVVQRADDYQVGGNHYKGMKHQPWDVMQECMTKEGFNGFLIGCVIKYLLRNKGDDHKRVEDVRKAHHCLTKLLEVIDEAQAR